MCIDEYPVLFPKGIDFFRGEITAEGGGAKEQGC